MEVVFCMLLEGNNHTFIGLCMQCDVRLDKNSFNLGLVTSDCPLSPFVFCSPKGCCEWLVSGQFVGPTSILEIRGCIMLKSHYASHLPLRLVKIGKCGEGFVTIFYGYTLCIILNISSLVSLEL